MRTLLLDGAIATNMRALFAGAGLRMHGPRMGPIVIERVFVKEGKN